ncbi:MAG: hypothetical protein KGH93_01085 [Patescibacteria group bacterium]|nr:hypothetical protein [Patescibacteria group bacterium]MDE1945775.1 hypothetical protein [Patescibacteria group bacterium]
MCLLPACMASSDNFNSILVRYGAQANLLCFFGALHSNDPKHPQFSLLKNTWNFFEQGPGNKVVVIESTRNAQNNFEIFENFEEAVKQCGEPGGMYVLSRTAGIEVIFGEIDADEQRKMLLTEFDAENVAYACLMQSAAVWFRAKRKLSFTEALVNYVKKETMFSSIYGFEPTMDWLYEKHKELFGNQPIDDERFVLSICDPRKKDTLINKIVSKRTEIRNEHLLAIINDNMHVGRNIFVMYGRGHLDMLYDELIKSTFAHDPHIHKTTE